jgi:hypothetical protein
MLRLKTPDNSKSLERERRKATGLRGRFKT